MEENLGSLVGRSLGAYRIEASIGAGSMGEVYFGRDPRLARPLAIKILHPHLSRNARVMERFEQEARVLASLAHPNIVTVLEFMPEVGAIVMEFLAGETLEARLRSSPEGLAFGELYEVFDQVAAALDHAHRRGVVHRDLKPANIMLVALDGRTLPKVVDFGIAKITAGTGGMTAASSQMGTAWYMAPEQVRSAREVDGRADIYALGACLYHAAVGRAPFPYESDFAAMRAHLEDALPAPSSVNAGVSTALESVICRAMAKDPGDRYATAQAFRQALSQVAAGNHIEMLNTGMYRHVRDADVDALPVAEDLDDAPTQTVNLVAADLPIQLHDGQSTSPIGVGLSTSVSNERPLSPLISSDGSLDHTPAPSGVAHKASPPWRWALFTVVVGSVGAAGWFGSQWYQSRQPPVVATSSSLASASSEGVSQDQGVESTGGGRAVVQNAVPRLDTAPQQTQVTAAVAEDGGKTGGDLSEGPGSPKQALDATRGGADAGGTISRAAEAPPSQVPNGIPSDDGRRGDVVAVVPASSPIPMAAAASSHSSDVGRGTGDISKAAVGVFSDSGDHPSGPSAGAAQQAAQAAVTSTVQASAPIPLEGLPQAQKTVKTIPQFGSIHIVVPSDVEVILNGNRVKPGTQKVRYGTHRVELIKGDGKAVKTVKIGASKPQQTIRL
jgi:serine/threonine protein kinase